ncbi:peptide chain release factor N(5)-glutamine methyltransferase [Marinospirillum alkaliphilum]|uniref:Release factor glutamine methyltransferase n=1 Tax=Marinospirillum alkaliphilum DSM 21637 TaxID=1122209 RepID=A0A1K1YX17_9GAMM|nr:peptide chain release factor N(5)-glutamine methyltransferase [Marinospirillum alkaliphilum]SFX66562.1 release factor glutamine methyltransferase [Marinospirillum alkaliphilum DSM 21637]
MPEITLAAWLQQATNRLQQASVEAARHEAQCLLSWALDKNTAFFHARPEFLLNATQQQQLAEGLQRRLTGEPLAWILGQWEFWGLPLQVSPATLIPRADTECLVELALQVCELPQARVLDLGTGTGAVALALKKERPDWQVDAVDFQPDAVKLAQANAQRLGLDIRVWQSDWWQQVPAGQYDLLVSNPPYIHPDDPHLSQGDLRYEPTSALVGGQDGLDAYRALLNPVQQRLTPGGYLLVEHGYDQAAAVAALFSRAGLVGIQLQQDLAGQPRVTLGRRPAA